MQYYTKVLKTLRLIKIIDQITPAWAMSFFFFFFAALFGLNMKWYIAET